MLCPCYISRLLEQLLKAAYHRPQDPQGTRLFFSSTYRGPANLLSGRLHRIIFSLKSASLKLLVEEGTVKIGCIFEELLLKISDVFIDTAKKIQYWQGIEKNKILRFLIKPAEIYLRRKSS